MNDHAIIDCLVLDIFSRHNLNRELLTRKTLLDH